MSYKPSNLNGQATMGNSSPVVIASDQSAVPVSGTIEIGSASLSALENITVAQTVASAFLCKPYGAVSTTAPVYTNSTDNALSLTTGGSLRVDVTALPAGSNAIGKLAANDGVDIGDVTINNASIAVTGSFYQATQPVSFTWSGLTNTELRASAIPVSIATIPSHAVTNAGSFSVQVSSALPAGTNNIGDVDILSVIPGTGATNLGKQTDSTAGLTDTGIAILGIRDDALTTLTPVDGDYTRFRVNSVGRLWASTTIDSALPAGTNAIGSITNTSFAATQSGAWNIGSITTLPALPTGANTIGTVNIGTVPTLNVNSHAVTNAGTFAVQVTSAPTTAVTGAFWQTTQPVSLASVPSHAVTMASTTITGSVAVTGSFYQATQPVSGTVVLGTGSAAIGSITNTSFAATQSGTWNIGSITTLPALATGTNTIGTVNIGTVPTLNVNSHAVTLASTTITGSVAVTGSFYQTTQPVSITSVPSHAVTNVGTFAVQATQSGTWNIGSITTLPALAAGTNAIGKLTANPGIIIGAVEIAPATTNAVLNSTTTAYASSLIIKAAAGVLYSITGYNSKTSTQFIQLHDSATLPANTAVPKVIFAIAASSNFAFDLTPYGRSFSAGITVCNSSTGPTKTIGSADCWFDAQYK